MMAPDTEEAGESRQDECHSVTLGEGNTPLTASRHIGPALGLRHLYFKLESVNPTGSYKDRFAAAAISDMRRHGKRRVVCTSSGNTGSALAAYAAAAGMNCTIAVVEGAPLGKLRQMLAYGAHIYKVRGFGIDAETTRATFDFLEHRGSLGDAQLQISAYRFSPRGMAGIEAMSHEISAQLRAEGRSVDHVFTCAGGGGLTLATARGFAESRDRGEIEMLPRVHCVQPSGNNTIAGPLRAGLLVAEAVACTTRISGLQVASVIDGDRTIAACRETGGTGFLVEDADVFRIQRELARREGIFCEPAGAVPLAGLKQAVAEGKIDPGQTIVCLVTSTGFKDLDSFGEMHCPTISLAEFHDVLPAS
jgi:threonine synthase